MLLAQANPQWNETEVFISLTILRPNAWPNSLMIAFADELLGRDGRLTTALCKLYAYQLKRDPNARRLLRMGGHGKEVEMALDASGLLSG